MAPSCTAYRANTSARVRFRSASNADCRYTLVEVIDFLHALIGFVLSPIRKLHVFQPGNLFNEKQIVHQI